MLLGATGCSFDGPATTGASDPADGSTGIGGGVCGGPVEASDLISHWRFERGDRERDDSGVAEAVAVGQLTTISGPGRCGDAVRFEASDGQPNHVLIDDRAEWDEIGSFDLFVRYPAGIVDAGIVSRDASGDNNGNVGLYFGRSGDNTTDLIILRVQRPGSGDVFRCANRPAPDTWIHVGVNFGGSDAGDEVELWIDGTEGAVTGSQSLFGGNCGDGGDPLQIDGSADPWVLGASIERSSSGDTNNMSRPLVGGAVDNLRFVSQRRDFSSN